MTLRATRLEVSDARVTAAVEFETVARLETVILIDDVDGSPADESVDFALDGVRYSIDLTANNAKQFRATLDPWIQAGRRIGGRRRRGTGQS